VSRMSAFGPSQTSLLDPDLEVVLMARNSLSDPDKWRQGHLGKGQRKCLAGHWRQPAAFVGPPETAEADDGEFCEFGELFPARLET
jgi:hypothetical protein